MALVMVEKSINLWPMLVLTLRDSPHILTGHDASEFDFSGRHIVTRVGVKTSSVLIFALKAELVAGRNLDTLTRVTKCLARSGLCRAVGTSKDRKAVGRVQRAGFVEELSG